jgi:hypothetical protein
VEKAEMIVSIINMFDEIDSLKLKLAERPKPHDVQSVDGMTAFEKKLFDYGKKLIVKEITYSYRTVSVSRDDNDELRVTSYSQWLNDKLCEGKIPDTFAHAEIKDYFDGDFKSMYETEKKAALAAFHEEAQSS